MNDKDKGFDLRSIMDSIGEALRSAGDSVSETVKPAAVWSESGLRAAVLNALSESSKTGHDVIGSIHDANEWGIKPSSAKVYPLLEQLLDEQLVTVKVVKDRKVYTLTEAGKEAAAETAHSPEGAPSGQPWPKLSGELTTASRRLARAAFDVSQHGTDEQRAAATAAIDEARRKINEILAAK